jgi:hypothetical protein
MSTVKNIVSPVNLGLKHEWLVYVEKQYDDAVNKQIVQFIEKHKSEPFAKNLIYFPNYAKQNNRPDITTESVSKFIFNSLDYANEIVPGFLCLAPQSQTTAVYTYQYFHCDKDFMASFDIQLTQLLLRIEKNPAAQQQVSSGLLDRIFALSGKHISHLYFTADYELVLTDYNNLVLKGMTPLYKAVYLLFLNRQDGITLKEFSDYKPKLLRLYKELAKRNDYNKNINTIENLCNPLDPSYLNQTLSKINKILKDTLPPHAYETYAILGERGMPKRIALDRTMAVVAEWIQKF